MDLDHLVSLVYLSLSSGEEHFSQVEQPEPVEMPAVPTRIIRFTDITGLEGAWYWGLSLDEAGFVALCVGEEGPEADWSSIVETLEFLPEE